MTCYPLKSAVQSPEPHRRVSCTRRSSLFFGPKVLTYQMLMIADARAPGTLSILMLSPRRFWSLRRIEHGPGQPGLVSDHCVIDLIHSLILILVLILTLILITDPDESYRVTPSHTESR